RPDALAAGEDLALPSKAIERKRREFLAAEDRLRPSLDDIEGPGNAVFGPFDVHRHETPGSLAVVLLDAHGGPRELEHLVVSERKPLAIGSGNSLLAHGVP